MGWSVEEMLRHPKRSSLLGVNKQATCEQSEPPARDVNKENEISFIVMGDPMGKPRMTQRDRWKKRPVVERYHDYCDRIKEAAPNKVLTSDVYAIEVTAFLAVPPSWSKKKQAAHLGQLCRAKPDWDNIGKAVCDALFKEDSMIAEGRARKFWCPEGEQRTEVKVWYLMQKVSS